MRYGKGYGSLYSDEETWVIILETNDFRTGATITFLAVFSQYYQLVIDGRNVGVPKHITAGTTATLKGNYRGSGPHTVSVVGCGPWSTPGLFDVTSTQSAYLFSRSRSIHFELFGVPEQFSDNDGGQFSNWNISGIQRFTNCRTVKNRTTYGEVDILLSTSGSVHTLTLSLSGKALARGRITGNGTVTLSELNNSGVCKNGTNTVTLAYTGDLIASDNAVLETAWPAKFNLYYRQAVPWGTALPIIQAGLAANVLSVYTSIDHDLSVTDNVTLAFDAPLTDLNGTYAVVSVVSSTIFTVSKVHAPVSPDTYTGTVMLTNYFEVPTATVYDDGRKSAASFDSGALDTGIYYCVVHQVNEDGEESGGTTNQSVEIVYVPAAPGVPIYFTGGAGGEIVNVINTTGNLTLNAAQSGSTFTNVGASGEVDLTLCAAVSGLEFRMLVCVDTKVFKFITAGGDKLFWLGTSPSTSGGTYIYSSELYSYIHIVCAVTGIWTVAEQPNGTWIPGPA